MGRFALSSLFILLLATTNLHRQQDPRIGLWGNGKPLNAKELYPKGTRLPFCFHGDSATMYLPRLKENTWHSEDDFYRVKTKRIGNRLFWLPPFGTWCELAAWSGNHFEYDCNGVTWQFRKVAVNDGDQFLQGYLRKRETHDYNIRENAPEEVLRRVGFQFDK